MSRDNDDNQMAYAQLVEAPFRESYDREQHDNQERYEE